MYIHLIDYLAYISGCYVSELKNMAAYKLESKLAGIDAEQCSLREWRECASYLGFPDDDADNSTEAKNYLLKQLQEN